MMKKVARINGCRAGLGTVKHLRQRRENITTKTAIKSISILDTLSYTLSYDGINVVHKYVEYIHKRYTFINTLTAFLHGKVNRSTKSVVTSALNSLNILFKHTWP